MEQIVHHWLLRFGLDDFLHGHVVGVMVVLPEDVRDDLLSDGSFRIFDYEPGRGVIHVPVGFPARGMASRR